MKISSSILNAKDRIKCVKKLNNTMTSYIHIDIMDGIFVSNTQLNNLDEIIALNEISTHKLDIHLMVENPIEYINNFNNMNIEYITFHLEIKENIKSVISKIKEKGYKVGIAIKPTTNLELIKPYLNEIDLILIMSVEPGKGGQQFLPTTPVRVNTTKKLLSPNNNNIKIEVDGGINDDTIKLVHNVDIAVVGSYIINSNDYSQRINELIKTINYQSNL